MRILLFRHGETAANAEKRLQGWSDFPLNSRGRLQAERLGPLIEALAPAKLFTSDLRRSMETAQPAARLLGIEPVSSPVFREYSWGVLEGLTWSEVTERYPAFLSQAKADLHTSFLPGQEDLSAFRLRVKQGLELLLGEEGAPAVALVGHGRYLNALVVEFLGLDFQGPWPFSFANTAVTILEAGLGRRRLIKFNEDYHLTGDAKD